MHTFLFHAVNDYHGRLKAGKDSCVNAVEFYLQQIKKLSRLNAFTKIFAEESLLKAIELDKQRAVGMPMKKLHGVVIAIKDVICYKGHMVTAASKMLAGFESAYTATALQYLIDEDAIIIGSCNCDEFAMGSTNEHSVYGKVLNALDETKVPGGSSGGSAVAVQADMCMLALGSDTGGSVRQPADFCGIIGLKPGYGTISRYGLIAYASSFDQIGIFGKNIADVSLLLNVMSAHDSRDSTMNNNNAVFLAEKISSEKKYRFAFLREANEHASLDKEIAKNISALNDLLMSEGHSISRPGFNLIDYIVPAYYVLTTAEASSNLGRYDGIRYGHAVENVPANPDEFYRRNRSEGFGAEVKKRIMLGSFVLSTGYYDAFYTKAQQIRRMLVNNLGEIFKTTDAVIIPVSPGTAFTFGQNEANPLSVYLADIYTVFANLTGVPAISLPLFTHSNKMPFGVQVLCARGNESLLLEISEMLMQRFTTKDNKI